MNSSAQRKMIETFSFFKFKITPINKSDNYKAQL